MATRKQKAEARTKGLANRASAYEVLAGNSERARLMSQVEAFTAVPTELTSFNRATTVQGAPLSCIWLVHGPSMGGKTAFLLALIRAFQRARGLAAYVDAEMSADTKRWFPALGVDVNDCLYVGRTDEEEDVKPLTYEEVVKEVDGILGNFQAGKKDKTIARGTPMIVVVDSISKMVPESLLKNLKEEGGKALRGGVGRTQALLNTAWLAEVGTKVGNEDILFAVIAHEMESQGAGKYAPDYKVRGGGSLVYDSMMQVRIEFAGRVKDHAADDAPMVGKRHRARILKNKHGPAFGVATFYTATGQGICPMGFDRVREVVHEGILRGTIEGPNVEKTPLTLGAKLTWKGRKMSLKQLYSATDVVESMARELDAGLVKDGRGGKDDASGAEA